MYKFLPAHLLTLFCSK